MVGDRSQLYGALIELAVERVADIMSTISLNNLCRHIPSQGRRRRGEGLADDHL
jgi:hypothetical protein